MAHAGVYLNYVGNSKGKKPTTYAGSVCYASHTAILRSGTNKYAKIRRVRRGGEREKCSSIPAPAGIGVEGVSRDRNSAKPFQEFAIHQDVRQSAWVLLLVLYRPYYGCDSPVTNRPRFGCLLAGVSLAGRAGRRPRGELGVVNRACRASTVRRRGVATEAGRTPGVYRCSFPP
jgi:hypothetical protein